MSDPTQAVAIIGTAGRFPGAPSVAALWQALRAGRELTRVLDDDVLRARGVSEQQLRDPAYVKRVGMLDEVALFDRAFFRLSQREARLMDPQHRMFLESAYLALENGGYADTSDSQCIGVFAGSSPNTYFLSNVDGSPEARDYGEWGVRVLSQQDSLAGRVAYHLNLNGPAVVAQTACSTSLVAVHLAFQALLAGECDMALAGGVSIRFPQVGYLFHEGGILSPDGRCRAFDVRSRGTVPGDGAGVVLLKRMIDATHDGDRVLAVLIGSAISNDAAARVGFTAPGPTGQASAIRQALAVARVDPGTITYVETHGTGTPLGDSVEIAALADAYAGVATPCAIGSIKSNLGHLDAAAGIAGLIKTTMCLRDATLPKSLHVEVPNSALERTRFDVVAATRSWVAEGPLRAGVSSFGIGGTNAHVVLEEAPRRGERAASARRASRMLALSAKTPDALRTVAARHAEVLEADRDLRAEDVAFTAGCRRPHHDHRLAVVGSSTEEWAAQLRGWASGSSMLGLTTGVAAQRSSRLAFVFSGQGAQWHAMGRELLAEEPVFRDALATVASEVRARAGWDLLEELGRGEAASRLHDTSVAQPCLFALQVGLWRLLESWGIAPTAVVGHSLGEIAAAHVSGALALSEAVRLAVVRGRIMHRTVGRGRMVAVELDAETAARVAAEIGEIDVAAANGPRATVLAGPEAALSRAIELLAARGIRSKRLAGDYAFHSRVMAEAAEQLAVEMRGLVVASPSLPMISSLDPSSPVVDADYWGRQVRGSVRFVEAIRRMIADGFDRFIELGPHPILVSAVAGTLEEAGSAGRAIGTMRRGHGERAALLEAVGQLHCAGHPIDFARIAAGPGLVVDLPPYPFAREVQWIDSAAAEPARADTAVALESSLGTLRERLVPLDRDGRVELVLGFVRAFVASSTALPESMVASSESLIALGVDSLSTLALKERIREQLGISLAAEAAADQPSLFALAEHLVDRLADDVPHVRPRGTAERPELVGVPHAPTITGEGGHAITTGVIRPHANGYDHHVLEWAPAHPSATALLVHGYLDAAASWGLVAPGLAQAGLRVLAPDLRGCGDGPRVPLGAHYYFADHVRDLSELVASLCCDQPIFLVGHSLGGLIALAYAGSFPERVAGLALLEGVGMAADTPQSAPLRLRRWCLDGASAGGDEPFRLDEAIARFSQRNADVSPAVLRDRLRPLLQATDDQRYTWKCDPRARTGADSLAPEVLRAFLHQIACPVLAVGGGASPRRAADEADRLAACRSVRAVELDGAGHMMHWTRPDALTDLLVTFLRGTSIPDLAATARDPRRQPTPTKECDS